MRWPILHWYLTKPGAFGLIPFALITLGALYLVPRISFAPAMRLEIEDRKGSLRHLTELEARFDNPEYVQVVVPVADPFTTEALSLVSELTERLAVLPAIDTVISVTTIQDPVPSLTELRLAPLVPESADNKSTANLRQTMNDSPLLRDMLLSRGNTAWFIYAIPRLGVSGVVIGEQVHATVNEGDPRAFAWGPPVVEFIVDNRIVCDFLLILGMALGAVLIVQCLLGRNLRIGLALWSGTVVPTVWTLALFPLLGISMQNFSILVPTIVAAVSTSYGIHLLREVSLSGHASAVFGAKQAAPTISVAAITTALGFASLFVSRFPDSRRAASLIMAGIFLSVLYALGALPTIFDRVRAPHEAVHRRSKITVVESRPIAFSVLLIVTASLLFGISRSFPSNFSENFIDPHSMDYETMRFFKQHTGGVEEITLLIDGGEQYSLVDPGMYEKITELTAYLESRSDVAAVLSYVHFVDWINGRLSGSRYPVRPESAEEIGESLELLASYPAGISILSLLDRTYSTARVLFRFREEEETLRTKHLRFRTMLEETAEDINHLFPELVWHYSGSGYRAIEQSRLLLNDQRRGVMGYFLILLCLLFVVFRKRRYVIAAVLPPASGVITYIGISGLLGIPITAISGIIVALIMGVTVDDVVYFLHRYRIAVDNDEITDPVTHTLAHTGVANIQTTLVLCTGVGFLALSFFRTIASAAIPAIISMCVATAVTLVIVPSLLRRGSAPLDADR